MFSSRFTISLWSHLASTKRNWPMMGDRRPLIERTGALAKRQCQQKNVICSGINERRKPSSYYSIIILKTKNLIKRKRSQKSHKCISATTKHKNPGKWPIPCLLPSVGQLNLSLHSLWIRSSWPWMIMAAQWASERDILHIFSPYFTISSHFHLWVFGVHPTFLALETVYRCL